MAILEVRNLKKYFPVTSGVFLRRTGWVYALDDVSFVLNKGETLGIVGESGCGKTTLARCIMGLYQPSDGQVIIKGQVVSKLKSQQRKELAKNLQMIFQDPFESLNPRQTIKEILEEKYIIHGKKNGNLDSQIKNLIERVGLLPETLSKFPHEFSGGQRQRIGIARAISLEPEIIICDEPVSALDVSVQSKILNLLLELQKFLGLTYMFISHDLSVVKHVSDTIAVMYLGKIIEMADATDIYNNGQHPYTKALLSSIPLPDPESDRNRIVLKGEVPSVENPPFGCRFNTRCEHVKDICLEQEPKLLKNTKDSNHLTACHFFF
ncbi:MAG: ATP-binding cassette domain-containing protein [Proteobacteria bacterium]|nr:ATP-binding cassette domain-containing protein [Pseudomonadota bacterium]MBU1581380.1 ATP-binding cassette domain-containing protein [Pseudomonadota bacterium]MBU2629790.1 ATP-binding cassette domain-containing protein [Pseudomonadota bacterium]